MAQGLLFSAQAAAIISVSVHPTGEYRHAPIVEDAAAAFVQIEPFHAGAGFTDFLAVQHDNRPFAVQVLQRSEMISRLSRAEPGLLRIAVRPQRRGDAPLIMIL